MLAVPDSLGEMRFTAVPVVHYPITPTLKASLVAREGFNFCLILKVSSDEKKPLLMSFLLPNHVDLINIPILLQGLYIVSV